MQAMLRPLYFFLFLFIFSYSSNSQLNPGDALKKLYDHYPQEKIYMWFNKAEYVAGETTWFKIYVFSGYELSNISKSVYVELYDREKKLISDHIFPLIGGIGQGSISLAEKLAEDVYYIRSYTRWMMNFDESFQYVKPIAIYNPSSSSHLIKKRSDWMATIHPEGNSLIDGLNTKIAVRLTSNTELPAEWSGYIFETGKESVSLAEFTSLDKNVASFYFTPVAGKQYQAIIRDGDDNTKKVILPFVKPAGLSMRVDNKGDTIFCRLHFKNVPGEGRTYNVIGQMQQQLVYFASFKRKDPVIKVPIPVKDMLNGILHLTVFDDANNVIAERLVFTNPHSLFIDSNVIDNYIFKPEPRTNNSIEIIIDSLSWNSYALSITNEELPSSTEKDNLLSTLWLTSDLSIPVQDAATYFTHEINRIEALDALLLSDKLKRFQWPAILKNFFPVIRYLPHNYLSFKGVASRNKRLLPSKEITFIFYAPDSSNQFMLARSDSSGALYFENFAFVGNVTAYYQLNEKKGNPKNINIRFEKNNKPFPFTGNLPGHHYTLAPRVVASLPQRLENALQTLRNEKGVEDQYKTLQEVIVRSTTKSAKEQLHEKLTSGIFRSQNDISFDFVNEEQNAIAYTNILQWLDGRVAGLNVQYENGIYVPYIRGERASIFLDEMNFSAEGISMISISDIALVKVMKGPMSFIFGAGAGGVIAIYTAKGNMKPAQREPLLNNNVLSGYDAEKEFFIPDYTNTSIRQAENDVRDQLLWTSLLVPNNSMISSIHRFVNNDKPGKLRVIVQGFTEKGLPVFKERIIYPTPRSF